METPLMLNHSEQGIRLLLDSGAEIHRRDKDGWTVSASCNLSAIIGDSYIIGPWRRRDVATNDGDYPIHRLLKRNEFFPISSHDLELVEFFVNSDDANKQTKGFVNLRVSVF